MSLAVLADHMASKGRGPDSMLIHMSPREVQGLQALAENHGGSLTINPETGLPEAGFLDKLLPTIIGAGISFFSQGTIDPMTAAAMVGGVETARTGDIGKGISAGLGAYGGATLTAGMAGTGADTMTTAGMGNYAETLAARGLEAGTPAYGEAASQLALDSQKEALATPFADRLSTGYETVKKAGPMQYLKANAMPLAGAFGPAILAGMSAKENMPKTTTGMIAPHTFDPYSGTYTAAVPYPASPNRAAEGGLMGLAAGGIAGYGDGDDVPRQNGMAQGGMYDFAQRSEPVVRMAEGGVAGYAAGGDVPAYFLANPDVAKAFNENAGGYATGLNAQQYADLHYATHGANEIAAGTRALSPTVDLASSAAGITPTSAMAALVANPNMRPEEFDVAASQYNLNNYNATSPLIHGYQVANDKTAAAQQYLKANPDVQAYIDSQAGKDYLAANPQFDASDIAFTHFQRYGEKEGRKFGETLPVVKTPVVTSPVVTPSVVTPPITYNTAGTNVPGGLEGMLGLPPGVSGAGITTVNPNGTITTRPNIPGIPAGGFTGMTSLRDAYEQGGGSLGYVPYTPKTIEEFDTKYGSKLTGGSKQSYDFLTGKTKYSPTPYTPTGEVMKPYAESVLGVPMASSKKMYLFDPTTKQYKINPDYAIPTYDKDGKKSLDLTNQDVINYVKSPEYSNDDTFVSWMTANNLSPEQVAAATGIPLSEVYKKIKKAKPVEKVADTPITGQNDGGGGGEANGGLMSMARGGMAQQFNLGDYSDGGRLLRGPGDGVSDSIPASIGGKRPARLADGEFVVPARIVSELGNGSTEAGARKLYAMMDRIQKARRGTVGKGRVAKNSRSEKYLPA